MTTTTAPKLAAPPEPAPAPKPVPDLVAHLRATFASGRTRPLAWRREQLERLRLMLVEREADLLGALHTDLGKPATEAWATDVGFVISEIDYVRRHLRAWMRPERVWTPMVARPGSARLVREPYGVALVIAPWNYPVQLLLSPMVGALAAGNCVVGKPSELAPATSAVLARTIPKYLDTDAVAVVEGGVPETQALLAEPFDYIFYTGNGRVARVVMEAAAKHLTPVTLELGGKSPVIVDGDADLEVAARRVAWGKYLNAGQTCIAPDYALVTRGAEERFVEQVRRAVFDFYGADPKDSPDYGRIVNDQHTQRLAKLLDGGTATVGGTVDRAARYVAPTVLQQVKPDAAALQEEIFGPILPVLPVDSIDAAIEYVNAREKPLALYLFSGSRATRQHVLDRTSSGGAAVNATMFQVSVPGLPFGGIGPSGMGAYHGKASFDTFSHAKPVFRKATKPDPALAYPPYTSRKDRLIRRFL
ncbi:MAG TPA: aldehyde dehydrogenase family protein [Acidimicrobiia bacterium]|nr:aldehyde dehydrogenase family protein [Acidimicrobiia bacterium]